VKPYHRPIANQCQDVTERNIVLYGLNYTLFCQSTFESSCNFNVAIASGYLILLHHFCFLLAEENPNFKVK
jgi:hypothetical protein